MQFFVRIEPQVQPVWHTIQDRIRESVGLLTSFSTFVGFLYVCDFYNKPNLQVLSPIFGIFGGAASVHLMDRFLPKQKD